jgi:hypothetical protein
VREELPGKGKEIKKEIEAKAEEARGKFDAAVCLMVYKSSVLLSKALTLRL